ncbi:MAG: hypothetical protein JXD23_15980 [Spirochaetales bacterium]|nr:hypothetical protein [Spirochaetales bacterium]
MKGIFALICALLPLTAVFATEYAFDANKDGKADKWYGYENNQVQWEKTDLNFDGTVDAVVEFDERGKPKYEKIDNNFDGIFDTFYSYEKGKLVLEEIDSNYDGMIDLRINMDGIYVLSYEQDTDFDGIFDKTRMFGPE